MAHHASGGNVIPVADAYRHLDTIERFLMAIGANKSAIEASRESKQATLIQMASGMIAPSPPQPEVVHEPARKEDPVQVPGPEKLVFPQIIVPETEVKVQTAARTQKGIAAGSFQLIGPGESMATEIASFDGRSVAATAIPWTAIGPDGHEFLIHVVLMDEDGEGEFGQVFCESRLSSPGIWDDIVRRLRIGIRRLGDGQLTMDLRIAVRENGERAAKRIVPLAEIETLIGLDTSAILLGLGANAVGSRAEITGETNRTRNWPSVTFAADDIVTPAAAFVLTTLLTTQKD
jgi:hypothetical protein